MKSLFSILFICLLLSKPFYGLFWHVKFQVYQKEIAIIECENKDRPEMHCNGKCYLAKQLKKIDDDLAKKKEEKNKTESNLKSVKNSEYQHQEIIFQLIVLSQNLRKEKNNFHFQDNYNYSFLKSYFHPPSIS